MRSVTFVLKGSLAPVDALLRYRVASMSAAELACAIIEAVTVTTQYMAEARRRAAACTDYCCHYCALRSRFDASLR